MYRQTGVLQIHKVGNLLGTMLSFKWRRVGFVRTVENNKK